MTASLPSCAWKDNRCRIGLILGTGTNACYLEDVKNIQSLNQEDFSGQEHMVVNTEWGAFGDNGELDFIKTKWLMDNHITMNEETFDTLNRKVSILDIDFAE